MIDTGVLSHRACGQHQYYLKISMEWIDERIPILILHSAFRKGVDDVITNKVKMYRGNLSSQEIDLISLDSLEPPGALGSYDSGFNQSHKSSFKDTGYSSYKSSSSSRQPPAQISSLSSSYDWCDYPDDDRISLHTYNSSQHSSQSSQQQNLQG